MSAPVEAILAKLSELFREVDGEVRVYRGFAGRQARVQTDAQCSGASEASLDLQKQGEGERQER